MNRLSPYVNDRNRGLGRNASDVSPHEFVEHQIPEDDDLDFAISTDDLVRALLR
jgi:hypothetical protein